jgi:hypothetical protein
MQIEDSYEGAVRRLAKLSNAGVDLLPSRRDDHEAKLRERLRDLEELATLATEENEKLTAELLRANETIARLEQQVSMADRQRLRELVETPSAPKERRPVPRIVWKLLVAGIAAAGLIAAQPWRYTPQAKQLANDFARKHVIHPWAVPVDHLPAPVVVAPPEPVVAPPPPVVVEVAAAAVEPAPKKHKRHKSKRASKPKKARAAAAKSSSSSVDPLLGL